jgi:hypothetical protein
VRAESRAGFIDGACQACGSGRGGTPTGPVRGSVASQSARSVRERRSAG